MNLSLLWHIFYSGIHGITENLMAKIHNDIVAYNIKLFSSVCKYKFKIVTIRFPTNNPRLVVMFSQLRVSLGVVNLSPKVLSPTIYEFINYYNSTIINLDRRSLFNVNKTSVCYKHYLETFLLLTVSRLPITSTSYE